MLQRHRRKRGVNSNDFLRKGRRVRERLEDEWNTLQQKVGEGMTEFVGRAKAIWMKLTSYGDTRKESSMC